MVILAYDIRLAHAFYFIFIFIFILRQGTVMLRTKGDPTASKRPAPMHPTQLGRQCSLELSPLDHRGKLI